jgi:tetratricopeptide (TPR) repeat protein
MFAVPLSAHTIPSEIEVPGQSDHGASSNVRVASGIPAVPEVPHVDIAGFPPETRNQVAQAYAAARQRPADAEAVGRLGMLLDLYHRPKDAALCYQRAHQMEPKSFKWLYYWSSLLLKQKSMEEALRVLASAVQLEPEYLPTRLRLGEALVETGKSEAAEKVYEGILRDYPDSAEAYYGLGRVRAGRGDQAAAAESYRKACELFPAYGAAHYGLAMAYRKLGRVSEAQEQANLHERNPYIIPPVPDPLRDELRALDSSGAGHLERGVQLEAVGRINDAIAETEKALELDPSIVKAHVNLLILYGRIGNAKKAEEHYKAVAALDPAQLPDAYYNYGVLLVKEGNFEEAEKAFRKTLEIAPTNDAAHDNLGYLLERQGKLAEAASEYRKALEANPSSRQAHFKLGRILVNQQQYQEAIEQFRLTLTPVDEDTPSYLYALGAAYGRAGDNAKALAYMKQAKELAIVHGQTALVSEIEKDLERVRACEGCSNSGSR